MAKLSQYERFDTALTALLERRDGFVPPAGDELAALLRVASDLRALPRESFRARLKTELEGRTTMSTNATPARETTPQPETQKMNWKRAGFRTVTPYLIVEGAGKFMEFIASVFGATERFRVPRPDGKIMHGEANIGDSIVEFSDGNEQFHSRPMPIHVYVPDVDAVYARALQAGATTLHAPANQEYGDRDCSVRDAFGNNWYIGTHRGESPVPAGLPNLMPFIHAVDAQKVIDFMKEAFGAEEIVKVVGPEGTIAHCKMGFGEDAVVELSEARALAQPMPGLLHMYVPDADAASARAIAAGAKALMPIADQPYGERNATLIDPFGNMWTVATHKFEFKG